MSLQSKGIESGTDKAMFGYLPIYEKYLEKYLHIENINILEIGILGGSSLKMWRSYFPKAKVLGSDIQTYGLNIRGETVNSSFFESDSNSKFYLCDQSKEDQLKQMCEDIVKDTGRGIDIFIDDGSHFQPDMMLTLGVLFPYLSEKGIFILEDICTEEGMIKNEELMRGGAHWWGSDEDPDLSSCVERTLLNYKETGNMVSPYLSEEMSTYLNNNISSCDYYQAQVPPITPQGTSSLAVLTKK